MFLPSVTVSHNQEVFVIRLYFLFHFGSLCLVSFLTSCAVTIPPVWSFQQSLLALFTCAKLFDQIRNWKDWKL